jgi:hypothetical protein
MLLAACGMKLIAKKIIMAGGIKKFVVGCFDDEKYCFLR